MDTLIGAKIHITGIVQGVGFRPFVFGLAQRYSLVGWVRNTSAGVDIEIDAKPETIENFIQALRSETPPLAKIDQLEAVPCKPGGYIKFEILSSETIPTAFQPVSPDVCICEDCLRELFDSTDQRYLYPFINCTNCGPRFTIINDIPYDRPNTTMRPFEMCPYCANEYNDPMNRRFHAQPVACPVCGPQIWLETGENLEGQHQPGFIDLEKGRMNSIDGIKDTQRLLSQGKIVAIKGLGGFHLACDALNTSAVSLLRQRKLRVDKPFALMMPKLKSVMEHCYVNDQERDLLCSRERPIVILQRRSSSPIPAEVAPGQKTLGVMLPYTPLHQLLLNNFNGDKSPRSVSDVLVMTSGNLSEEPIATTNQEARQRLAVLADAFLMHNRSIQTRCDDSVARVFWFPQLKSNRKTNDASESFYHLRRSRGYAPYPIHMNLLSAPTLAVGAELKNTFCITRHKYAFISQYIGDMENYETLCAFEEGIHHFERLFRVSPEAIAYDLHPDYLATRYAIDRGINEQIPTIGVQHHHAHIAACMAEHNLQPNQEVIGLAFDGTGYGKDGAIWGGEILIADYKDYKRPYHLSYVPLPGGDLATRQPWRMALSWLAKYGITWDENLFPVSSLLDETNNSEQLLSALRYQIQSGVNTPLTSSMGRLFDAVVSDRCATDR